MDFYQCPDCNRKYKTALKLRQHTLTVHEKVAPREIAKGPAFREETLAQREQTARMLEERARAAAYTESLERHRQIEALTLENRRKFEEIVSLVLNRPDDGDYCKICYDAAPDYANAACGHKQFCKPCLTAQPKCPLCQKLITTVIRIFT